MENLWETRKHSFTDDARKSAIPPKHRALEGKPQNLNRRHKDVYP